jgi:hypothetical protein
VPSLVDRLYSAWLVQNGSGDDRLHRVRGASVGAQRRSRHEGYPRDQAKSPASPGRSCEAGAALAGVSLRGGGAAPVKTPAASCQAGPPREGVQG